jgi:hypothetical protein
MINWQCNKLQKFVKNIEDAIYKSSLGMSFDIEAQEAFNKILKNECDAHIREHDDRTPAEIFALGWNLSKKTKDYDTYDDEIQAFEDGYGDIWYFLCSEDNAIDRMKLAVMKSKPIQKVLRKKK